MELGKLLYVKDAGEWRKWLFKNHKREKEIWLVFWKKSSGRERVSYNDAVDEALCFGWIDSTVKSVGKDSFAQRFTPRRPKSLVSELNKERIRRLIKFGKMMDEGLSALGNWDVKFEIPEDILKELKKDKETWKNFKNFPDSYKSIRIAFIDGARKRPEEFERRLNNFLKMTKMGKTFGMLK